MQPRPEPPRASRKVAIVQSNYIPWKGYFDLIAAVDEFIFLDDVQYTERDWRNRNRIKTAQGLRWLSVPVRHERDSRISDVTVASDQGSWVRKHWQTIALSYATAPHAAELLPWLESLYEQAASLSSLSQINQMTLGEICSFLEITTRLTCSTDYFTCAALDAFTPTDRLIALCQQAGARVYLSGPAAQAYMDVGAFERAGIEVEWMSYADYPEYQQLHGEFEHGVSIVDLLLMEGHDAWKYMKFAPKYQP